MYKFKVGDIVKKIKGYKHIGIVVTVFKTVAGLKRLVVDNGDGLLMIYNEEQLELIE